MKYILSDAESRDRGTQYDLKGYEMKSCQVVAIFVPNTVKNTGNYEKLKDFHFSNACEEGESPRTLQ